MFEPFLRTQSVLIHFSPNLESFLKLHSSVTLPDSTWVDQSTSDTIQLCKIASKSSDTTIPTVTHSLSVNSDLSWSIIVHGRRLIIVSQVA